MYMILYHKLMLPSVVTPSELRAHLAEYLKKATESLVLVKEKHSNKVILDEKEYNRLAALANQFIEEDPEGKYRPAFVKEALKRSQDGDIDESVTDLTSLL